MRKIIPAVTVTIALLWLVTAPFTAHASAAVNWTARTCTAAAAYQHHPTRAGLEVLVTDSFHVTPRYLGADTGQLYADVEGGAPARYIADDEGAIWQDCHNGYGL